MRRPWQSRRGSAGYRRWIPCKPPTRNRLSAGTWSGISMRRASGAAVQRRPLPKWAWWSFPCGAAVELTGHGALSRALPVGCWPRDRSAVLPWHVRSRPVAVVRPRDCETAATGPLRKRGHTCQTTFLMPCRNPNPPTPRAFIAGGLVRPRTRRNMVCAPTVARRASLRISAPAASSIARLLPALLSDRRCRMPDSHRRAPRARHNHDGRRDCRPRIPHPHGPYPGCSG